MSHVDPRQALLPSILDRLIDPDSGGSGHHLGYGLESLIDSVRRDLEELLNTHQSQGDLPAEFIELKNSVFAYGLPDPARLTSLALERSDEIERLIETLIGRFEPRLRDVRVSLVEPEKIRHGTMRLHIDARLRLEPAPKVWLETIVELTTGHASIQSSGA